MSGDDKRTFWDHLDELRGTLLRIIGVTALFGVVAFCFKEQLFQLVLAPTKGDFVTYRLLGRLGALWGSEMAPFTLELINIALAQQFIIHMKTSLYAGLLCASPYIIYELLRFISPALHTPQRHNTFALVGAGYFMFVVGVTLCYLLIFPLTIRFLGTYQVSGDVQNMISLNSYMSTFTGMSLMLGIVFELPVLCWIFAKLGLLKDRWMKRYRKHSIVVILIIAAIITPTSDAFTLALVSLPMWLLYELSIFVVSKVNKSVG